MQEFSSISVSSYEPGSLVGALNEQAAAGWDVVSIVPTGSSITAYLSREAGESTDAVDAAPVAAVAELTDNTATDTVTDDAVTDDAGIDLGDVAAAGAVAGVADTASDAVDPVDEPAGWAATDTAATEAAVVAEPVAEVVNEPVAEVTAAAAGAAPAGWYADPSSRFELRYWDGSQWTEHVSRGGQQFTDPPVA